MSFLQKIKKEKQKQVEVNQKQVSLGELQKQQRLYSESQPSVSFIQNLTRQKESTPSMIAEIKPKAPGHHNFESVDIPALVQEYEAGGARAISVLTDTTYFGGSLDSLRQARHNSDLPLLQKDFIVDEYQLWEGACSGANAALLLVDYFDLYGLKHMLSVADSIGIAAVVECSLLEEVPLALESNPNILMLNNRPIARIPENPEEGYDHGAVQNAERFLDAYPEILEWHQQPNRLLISASCVESKQDFQFIQKLPYDAILVGNAVSRATDRVKFLKQLSEK